MFKGGTVKMTALDFLKKWCLLKRPGLFTARQSAKDLKDMLDEAKKDGREEALEIAKKAASDVYCPCMKGDRECAPDFEIYWKKYVVDKVNKL